MSLYFLVGALLQYICMEKSIDLSVFLIFMVCLFGYLLNNVPIYGFKFVTTLYLKIHVFMHDSVASILVRHRLYRVKYDGRPYLNVVLPAGFRDYHSSPG